MSPSHSSTIERVDRIIDRADPASDWAFARELCCLTGRSGEPIEASRWPFFGELWVGPYERHLPSWSFIATLNGQRAGYLTGCPDTAKFEKARASGFDPELASRIANRRFEPNADTARFLKRLAGEEKSPEKCFEPDLLALLSREFPAHLHVNVDSAYRSAGLGAKLMNAFFERLRARSTPGVHVFCGERPVSFYVKNGFQELARIAYGEAKAPVFALGKTLP